MPITQAPITTTSVDSGSGSDQDAGVLLLIANIAKSGLKGLVDNKDFAGVLG